MIPVRSYMHLLARRFAPMWGRTVIMSIAVLSSIALQLVAPQLLKRVIDGALAGDPTRLLFRLTLVFLIVALSQQVVAVFGAALAEDIGWRATNALRIDLLTHVLDLDMTFHTHHSPGNLIERVDGDVTKLSNFFSAMVVHVAGNGLLILGAIVLLLRESLTVGFSILISTVVMFWAMGALHGVVMPWWQAERASSAIAMGQVGEMIDGTEDIAANGGRGFMTSRMDQVLEEWLPRMRMGWLGWGVGWGSQIIWGLVSTAVVYWFAARDFRAGTITIGGVYALIAYFELMSRPLHGIREQLQELQKAGAAIERVGELERVQSVVPPPGDVPIPSGPADVEVTGVTFTYPDEDGGSPVLHDVTFSLQPGHTLGLVGRTGSGKSTLAKLLTRIQVPSEGTVRIAGVGTTTASNLTERVAMVTQEVQLLRASIRDNVTFHDPSVADEAILNALTALGLDDWLVTQPDGLDTVIDGSRLSAGEAQLLAFTRVFLRNPGLVVMDEASSRLDPATEALLERAIDRLLENRTAVIIAHRLNTLERADEILILQDGEVLETGDRRSLAGDPSTRFARLLATGMDEVLS